MQTLPSEIQDLILIEHLLPSIGVSPFDPSKDSESLNKGIKTLASIELVCKSWRSSIVEKGVWEKALVSRFTEASLAEIKDNDPDNKISRAQLVKDRYHFLHLQDADVVCWHQNPLKVNLVCQHVVDALYKAKAAQDIDPSPKDLGHYFEEAFAPATSLFQIYAEGYDEGSAFSCLCDSDNDDVGGINCLGVALDTPLLASDLEGKMKKICAECAAMVKDNMYDMGAYLGKEPFKKRDKADQSMRFIKHHPTSNQTTSEKDKALLRPSMFLPESVVAVPSRPHTFIGVVRKEAESDILSVVEFRVTEEEQAVVNVIDLPGGYLDPSEVFVTVSPNGQYAAIVNKKGRNGYVISLENGEVLMTLERGKYQVQTCDFPIAFFEMAVDRQHLKERSLLACTVPAPPPAEGEGEKEEKNEKEKEEKKEEKKEKEENNNDTVAKETFLIYATDWNQVDVYDPRTGENLTRRLLGPEMPTQTPYVGTRRTLDYFYSGLYVSEDGRHVASGGWAWHPVGYVRWWSLEDWMKGDLYLPEYNNNRCDAMVMDNVYWQLPMCWAGHKLCHWGRGNRAEFIRDGLVIVDMDTGEQKVIVGVPKGELIFDRYLFSMMKKNKAISVWDLEEGEFLIEEKDVEAWAYHPHSKTFLCSSSPSSSIGPEKEDGDQWYLASFSEDSP